MDKGVNEGKLTQNEKSELKKAMSQIFLDKCCHHCGKNFLVRNGWTEDYAYRQKKRGKIYWFCSWSCFNKGAIKTPYKNCVR